MDDRKRSLTRTEQLAKQMLVVFTQSEHRSLFRKHLLILQSNDAKLTKKYLEPIAMLLDSDMVAAVKQAKLSIKELEQLTKQKRKPRRKKKETK